MGIAPRLFSSRRVCSSTAPIPEGNPNPRNFELVRVRQVKCHLVAQIRYPDCTNYEGMKIMVFKDLTEARLLGVRFLDPHFTDQDTLKPFARFEPTDEGWRLAIHTAAYL